jgi:predicted O-methyltransferase YrrM
MAKRTRELLVIARLAEIVLWPFTALAALWLRALRVMGFQHLPVSKRLLLKIGVLPIRDHYYEPMINPAHLRFELSKRRLLPAIDMNDEEQLSILERFNYQDELLGFPKHKTDRLEFYFNNGSFVSGDAEYLYSLLRLVKPRKLIEIGCGYSTLMARSAIARNRKDELTYTCEHICIEPFEQPWLEELDVRLIRNRVEECGLSAFSSLENGDILFIDSSHVIRPQGDVVFEYLELLPVLKAGVYVHVHDIFTPRDYLKEWVVDEIKLWNEQYLLEAFLSFNQEFRIVGAVNYLTHQYPEAIKAKFPILKSEISVREPGSFWMVRQ